MVLGSPPHVRGKPPLNVNCTTFIRDHPRMCGENSIYEFVAWYTLGSPPHVRGKHDMAQLVESFPGITPACAGKTKAYCCSIMVSWDHPRMCGENLCAFYCLSIYEGSPPHVRGKPFYLVYNDCHFGITPACAGKTRFVLFS